MNEQGKTLSEMLSSFAPTGKAAEETLHAIVLGEADALVIETKDGPRVYTLRDANEPYRELVERMPGAAVVLNADFTILYSNGGLARMLGHKSLAGRDMLDLVAPAQRGLAKELLAAGGKTSSAAELALIAADDSNTSVRMSAAPMSFDGQPCVALVVTALGDIDALKLSAADLRESERLFQTALASSPIAVFEQDLDLRYSWIFNPKLGYKAAEIIGKTDADIMDPGCLAALTDIKRRVIETGEPTRQEVAVAAPGAPLEIYDLYVEPRRDNHGQINGLMCAATDITARKRTEERLRQREAEAREATALLQAIIAEVPALIYYKDRCGRMQLANPATLQLVGKPWEQINQRTDAEFLDDKDEAALVMANDRRLMDTASSEELEETVGRDAHGPRIWLSHKTAFRNEEGIVVGLLGTSVDITERKRAEEALRKNETLTRLAADAARLTYAEFDFKTGRLHLAENFARVMGYTPRSLSYATTVAEFAANLQAHVSLADREQILASFREFVEGKLEDTVTYRVIGDDGMERWIEGRWTIEPDANGQPLRGVAANLDITERKRAEETVQRHKALLSTVFDHLPVGVWVFDVAGNLILRNPATHAIWSDLPGIGLDRLGEVKGWWPTTGERVAPDAWAGSLALRNGKTTLRQLVDIESYDGVRRTILDSALPLKDAQGAIIGAITINEDVTERLEIEKSLKEAKADAERANQAKSKFLAAASHDLRQPVQSLTLLLSAIERHVKDKPKAANMVEMAKASMASLNGMLTGILDISRLDAGVIAPDIASADLGALVDRMAREYAPRAAEVGLVLRHVPRVALARTDTALLERILRNLIENALRYTSKGGVLIGVRQRGENVRLDVIDTGIGIAANQQAEIFEEFRQLNNPARDSSQGLGLGLAIVSRLARLIGAEVEVASRLDHGTRFSLLLPLDKIAPPAVRAAPAIEDAGGRILIIEDNSGIRQAYEIMLGDWGYDTLSAASGEEALDRAAEAKWRFDAIIADHRLGPGLTGNAAATEIARRAGRAFPTMLVTGDTAEERLTEVSSSGFAMLHKPVEADDLRRTLASLLRGG